MSAHIAVQSVSNKTYTGIAYGMGAGALWGLVFLAPELTRAFTPLQLTIGRYIAFGVIAAVLIAPRWRVLRAGLSGRDWKSLIWLALFGNTFYYILLSGAVQTGGIAMTSLVVGFLPVAVTIIGSRDKGAVPLARLMPSLLFCCGGALCIGWQAIAAPASGSAGQPLTGLLLAIGALVSWTAYAVGNSRCLARLPQVTVYDWNLAIGLMTGLQALLLIPVSVATEPLDYSLSQWSQFATVSIGVAFLASIAGNGLWNRMSRLLPLTMVGQMILFETVFALIYGFVWEQRLPSPLEVMAFVMVTASVFTCIAAHRRPVSV